MMRKRNWKRAAALLCALLLCALCLPPAALAYTRIDTEQPASLTLTWRDGDTALSGAAFRLYRVAEVSAGARFTLSGDFADYAVALNGLDNELWRKAAETLAGYAAADKREPLRSGETDENGQVSFEDLRTGLYLVTGERHRQGGWLYTPEPVLVCLPTLNGGDAWVYDVEAEPKYSRADEGGGGETVQRRVLKVWEDGGAAERPESVTVTLLRDGEVYDTVTLNAGNHWSHSWSALPGGSRWQVVERDVPDGYTVTSSQEGVTFVVTNTRPVEPPDEPDDPVVPPDNPDEPPDNPDNPDNPDEPDIPQTGQLWWPVPLLAAAGMVCFLIGYLRRRRWNAEHEK